MGVATTTRDRVQSVGAGSQDVRNTAHDAGAEPLSSALFEVELAPGTIVPYETAEDLRVDAVAGRVPRESRLRCRMEDDDEFGEWQQIDQFAASHPTLRAAYRPVWDTALQFMAYGALAGVALKLLDTTVLMFTVDDSLGLIWLVVVASIALSSRWILAPAVGLFVSIQAGVGNLFLAAFTAGLVGLALGAPIGLMVGTIVGHLKRGRAAVAPDARPEGRRPYALGLVVPGIYLAVAIPAYIGFNVWALESVSAVDQADPSAIEECGPMSSIQLNASRDGAWTSACGSAHRSDRYAEFLTFSLSSASSVEIRLESDEDAYLYLIRGSDPFGEVVSQDDDGGVGTDSRISRRLEAGTYTIEGTTYDVRTTGGFRVRVDSEI